MYATCDAALKHPPSAVDGPLRHPQLLRSMHTAAEALQGTQRAGEGWHARAGALLVGSLREVCTYLHIPDTYRIGRWWKRAYGLGWSITQSPTGRHKARTNRRLGVQVQVQVTASSSAAPCRAHEHMNAAAPALGIVRARTCSTFARQSVRAPRSQPANQLSSGRARPAYVRERHVVCAHAR